MITWIGTAITVALSIVAINYTPNMTAEELGRMEIARRKRLREEGYEETDFIKLDKDMSKFKRTPTVPENGPQ